ncbi:MAG: AraC family transcriptional regulator [Lachnospiraceae bacterium]|nr:AraC family transcriptional regulator [Lachnospiraceae bacterium]
MEEQKRRLEECLTDIPEKRIRVRHIHLDRESHPPHPDRMRMGTDGKGSIESIELFPGIELSLHRYVADKVVMRHASVPDVVEIHHCRQGRCGLRLQNGYSLFLGSGEIFVQTLEEPVDSEITLPLGYYEGINIQIDLRLLNEKPPTILQEAGLNRESILASICPDGKPGTLPSEHDIEHIFKDLYDKPEHLRMPYYRIKTLELLLYLSQKQVEKQELISGYQQAQIERIHQIHEYLIRDLTVRPTIEELSRQFHMNTSTLKQVFRGVYGQPIATYMKEYRMRRAMEILADEKMSIADLARFVGYENQSKFTAAFKQFTGQLPSEYSRHMQKR